MIMQSCLWWSPSFDAFDRRNNTIRIVLSVSLNVLNVSQKFSMLCHQEEHWFLSLSFSYEKGNKSHRRHSSEVTKWNKGRELYGVQDAFHLEYPSSHIMRSSSVLFLLGAHKKEERWWWSSTSEWSWGEWWSSGCWWKWWVTKKSFCNRRKEKRGKKKMNKMKSHTLIIIHFRQKILLTIIKGEREMVKKGKKKS